MLSETLYKKLLLDDEFNACLEQAIASSDKNKQARIYHDLHKSAFELSVLFSPRAIRVPSAMGDFLVNVIGLAQLGGHYLSNTLNLCETAAGKPSVRRFDKLKVSLSTMVNIFSRLENDAKQRLDEYLTEGKTPSRAKISEYSKNLLKIRRSYFKVRPKLNAVQDDLNFSEYNYVPFKSLVMLVDSRRKNSLSRPASYVSAASRSPCSKRKDVRDKEDAAFIAKHGLPRHIAGKPAVQK